MLFSQVVRAVLKMVLCDKFYTSTLRSDLDVKIRGPKLASSPRLCGTEHCVSEKPLIFIVNHEYQRPKTYTHTVIPFSIVDPK